MATTTDTKNLPAVPPMRSGGTVAAIVPTTWPEVVQIASSICRANMAPKSYLDKQGNPIPDKVAVAIMHGLEVGFTPMAALQSIAVINGMPSVYGDGLLALIRASGLLEDMEETMEWGKDGPIAATCKMWRKGEKTPSVQTYTRADAIHAQLWGKAGPWTQHPARMLQWRARGWCGRDKFADVLRGLRLAEEVQDMVDITPVDSGPAPAEPKRADYQNKEPSQGASHHGDPGEGGQAVSEAQSPAAGGETVASGQSACNVTDVEDLNENGSGQPSEPEPLVFEEYTKAGEFFEFADPWLQEDHTEAEIIAFGAFYHKYMQERLKPDFRSPKVHEAILDTKALYDEALARALKKR